MATVHRKTEIPTRKGMSAQAPVKRKVRRDWAQIIFYGLSVVIVLSMVLGLMAQLFIS
jgi:hypothetical protein